MAQYTTAQLIAKVKEPGFIDAIDALFAHTPSEIYLDDEEMFLDWLRDLANDDPEAIRGLRREAPSAPREPERPPVSFAQEHAQRLTALLQGIRDAAAVGEIVVFDSHDTTRENRQRWADCRALIHRGLLRYRKMDTYRLQLLPVVEAQTP
jgi:hypothetical protein